MTRIRTYALGIALLLASAPAVLAGGGVVVLQEIPFAGDAVIRDKVKTECQLQTQLPRYIADFTKGSPGVELRDAFDDGSGDRQLHVVISSVNEGGNWFVGRHKGVTVSGELKHQGKVIGSFSAARSTSGGFAGGYKGACSFVGRCAKALGKDIAGWLGNPTMNAGLGDL
jgi:hypothetical protein